MLTWIENRLIDQVWVSSKMYNIHWSIIWSSDKDTYVGSGFIGEDIILLEELHTKCMFEAINVMEHAISVYVRSLAL